MSRKELSRLCCFLEDSKLDLQYVIDYLKNEASTFEAVNSVISKKLLSSKLLDVSLKILTTMHQLEGQKFDVKTGKIVKEKGGLNHLLEPLFPKKLIGKEFMANKLKKYLFLAFLNTELVEIKMSMKALLKEVFNIDDSSNYALNKYLKKELGIIQNDKTISFSYPSFENGVWIEKSEKGKPFIFYRNKFLSENGSGISYLPEFLHQN